MLDRDPGNSSLLEIQAESFRGRNWRVLVLQRLEWDQENPIHPHQEIQQEFPLQAAQVWERDQENPFHQHWWNQQRDQLRAVSELVMNRGNPTLPGPVFPQVDPARLVLPRAKVQGNSILRGQWTRLGVLLLTRLAFVPVDHQRTDHRG